MNVALKSVKQRFSPDAHVTELMICFKSMVNDCIRIGLEANATSLRSLSTLSYQRLSRNYCAMPSYYRLTAISKAAGILSARKKSLRRGIRTRDPYLRKPVLVYCYAFKVTDDSLQFSISKRKQAKIVLTKYTLETINNLEVRSFTITPKSLSLSIRKKIERYQPRSFVGIDRNASNVTYDSTGQVLQFDLTKVEEIGRTTKDIIRSFKRNDVRIRKSIASKYGIRRKERIKRILHLVSKSIVEDAEKSNSAMVFEDIRGIRNLYRRGNFQGNRYRARMNSVPWYEIKRQIEYKAAWKGVPVIQLGKGETRGTSKLCPVCGERLQEDRDHMRQLWCEKCKKWEDRDVVAAMNISYRGWLRFRQSKGEAVEAMVQEPRKVDRVILKVDASK